MKFYANYRIDGIVLIDAKDEREANKVFCLAGDEIFNISNVDVHFIPTDEDVSDSGCLRLDDYVSRDIEEKEGDKQ